MTVQVVRDFEFEFYHRGYLRGQRYGQAFCNRFGVDDNRLFYESDLVKAISIVWKEYVCE